MTEDSAHVKRVAEAIWRAHTPAPSSVTFDEIAYVAQVSYRRIAEASIDLIGRP